MVYLSGILNISFLKYNETWDPMHSGEVDIFQSKNADHNPQKKQMRIPLLQVSGNSQQDHIVLYSMATYKASLAVFSTFPLRLSGNPSLHKNGVILG